LPRLQQASSRKRSEVKAFSAEIEIQTSPEKIWSVLTDTAAYPEWEPNTIKIDGAFTFGETLVFHTKLSPNRAFKAKVAEMTPARRIVLVGGMPMGLFKAVRTYDLTQQGETVRFSTREEFSGLLSPLFGRMVPDLNPVMLGFMQGLKERSEADAA
jgi:hypothetical protein